FGLRADLHDRRAPAPLARPAAERRRARQLLRNPRDGIFQGRDPRELERGVGEFRPAQGGEGERYRRGGAGGGYVQPGGGCGGIIDHMRPVATLSLSPARGREVGETARAKRANCVSKIRLTD